MNINNHKVIYIFAFLIIALVVVVIYLLTKKENCDKEIETALVNEGEKNLTLFYSALEHSRLYNFTSTELIDKTLSELLNKGADEPISLTNFELQSKIYNKNKALFILYLNEIFYTLAKSYNYSTTPKIEVENFLRKNLPLYCTLEKLLIYTNSNLPSIPYFTNTWFNSYGGMILKYAFPGMEPYTFIILRGTLWQTEYLEDIKVILYETNFLPSKSNLIHGGFLNMYYNYTNLESTPNVPRLRDQILSYLNDATNWKKRRSLIISGHSLGGALANILFTDLCATDPVDSSLRDLAVGIPPIRNTTQVYTFAAPYFGNKSTSDIVANTSITPAWGSVIDIMDKLDVVPSVRAPYYVRIPSQIFCFDDGNDGIVGNHIVRNYKRAIIQFDSIFTSGAKSGKRIPNLNCNLKL